MCLYKRLIENPKYKATKKNGGVIPAIIDERVKYVPIGCGRCKECKKKKAREWKVRLMEEVKQSKNGKFVTLTFNNESIKKLCEREELRDLKGYELDNALATVATRLWLERWRKKYKKSVRHWLVTELGHTGTENIHMHGIIWTEQTFESIESTWQYGYIYPSKENIKKNYVNGRTVNYITKYVTKVDKDHMYYNSKILTSAGIGKQYTDTYNAKTNKYNGKETNEAYRTETGHKMAMPIYWRNKIYTEKEREQLWLNKLDENVIYIMGHKVKGDNYDEINRLTQWYQRKNREEGYGSDEVDWDRKIYEEQRRTMMMAKRVVKLDAGSKYIIDIKKKSN